MGIWAQVGRHQPPVTRQDVVYATMRGGGAELRKVERSLKA